MNKIIDGRRYDTETAEFICSNGQLNQNGCTRCTELYKKKTGEYFLYHRTMWQGESNSICPLLEIPMNFVEKNMTADEISEKLGLDFEE